MIVIGAGVMGSATARSLAQAGQDVVLLEQFDLGHERGSSHGTSRIFRLSYPKPMYVQMALAALPLWRELEAEAGEQILQNVGGIDAGAGAVANAKALEECGVEFEELDSASAKSRWRSIKCPEGPILFQADAGYLAADRAIEAFIASARAAGTEIRARTKVEQVADRGDHVEVQTADDSLTARRAVVTTGAWVRNFVDLPVRTTRETVAYFALGDAESLPVFIEWENEAFYALPAPGLGIKTGRHQSGPETNPDDEGTPDEATISALEDFVEERFPASGALKHSETCLYTNTPDESFILERNGSIVVGSACSGHGFKFAPEIGARLAKLATE